MLRGPLPASRPSIHAKGGLLVRLSNQISMEDGHDERVSTAVCLLARHRKHEDNMVKMEVCGVQSAGS